MNGTEKSLLLRILCLKFVSYTVTILGIATLILSYFEHALPDKVANGTELSLLLRILGLKFVSWCSDTQLNNTYSF